MAKRKRTNDKQWSTWQKTNDWTNRTAQKRGWAQLLLKSKQFLVYWWTLSCYFWYKPGDKSWIWKRHDCDYDKRNIRPLWHRYPVTVSQVLVAAVKRSKRLLQLYH